MRRSLLPSRFSMTELLVAMSLAVVIIALSVPTLRSILRSSSVDVAASTVAQHVRIGRQYAIAHNKYVAILIPTAEDGEFGGFDDPEYKASAIRICILQEAPEQESEDSDTWWVGNFADYLDNSKWEFLPVGTFVGYTDSFGPFDQFHNTARHRCNVTSLVQFPNATSPTQVNNVRSLIFRPNGSLLAAPQTGGNTTVVVHAGQLRNGDELILADLEEVEFEINRFTGKVRFDK